MRATRLNPTPTRDENNDAYAQLPPSDGSAPDGYVLASKGDGTSEYRVQTDVSAAAAAAVPAALAAAGALNASTSPSLDATRVPDPQVKTSGGSANNSTMPVTHVTTGLPAGISYGIKITRGGTLSSVIGQPYAGSKTNTDPLRILVTAGETATFAADLWTDQASSRARLDVFFYDSTGTLLGTSLTGVYANIAQNTWEQRVTSGVVPASATYAILQASIATQSGNTVTGAMAGLTKAVVVTGTVASPTYVDGTMSTLGWYWSGTAHASTSKKVQFTLAEVETPTGSQAKVDAHAAAADPHPGYLAKATVPTLATNRALDPQLKTTGASAAAPSYTLSRITTGLPAGFSYGLQTVRAGTLNTVVGQMYLAPSTSVNTDPLRIPVTAGEAFSLSAYVFTDQAGAKARLDMFFYDASGALLGTVVAGTYSNIAQNTWELRSQSNVIAPTSAAYVIPQATVTMVTGNAVTGAICKATGLLVASGAALPVYADGTFSGWTWSGAAHASTSLKKFSTATEIAAAAPAFILTKVGSAVALQRFLAGTKVLIQNLSLTGSSNGGFNIVSTTLDAVTVHSNGDDICPIRTQMGTIGANHGYSRVAKFANPDGKTSADLGSLWQDTAGRQYVLLAFSTDATPQLIMGGDYTTPGGITTSLDVTPATNLTHVSGATHTGAIDRTTAVATELLPSLGRITTTLWADGKPITADGSYTCREVVVRETYSILDYGSIYDVAKANIGVSYATLVASIATCVRVSNVYRWTASGCRVSASLVELKPTTLGQCGFVQSGIMAVAGGAVTRYLPGIGTVAGFNWGAGVVMTGYATDVIVASSDVTVSGRPPCLSLDVLNNGSDLIGFAMGYLPYGARGDELSSNANRLTHAPTKLWDLRGTQKNYPNATMAEAAGWGHVTAEAFRAYVDPTQVAAVLASKGDAASAWEALSTTADLRP